MGGGGGPKTKKSKADHGGSAKSAVEPDAKQRKMEGLCRCSLCGRTSKDTTSQQPLRHCGPSKCSCVAESLCFLDFPEGGPLSMSQKRLWLLFLGGPFGKGFR